MRIFCILIGVLVLLSFFVALGMYCFQFKKRIENIECNFEEINIYKKSVLFKSGKYNLSGCFYAKNFNSMIDNKATILIVHGYGVTHQNYMKEIYELVQRDYCVFAYDMTGCGNSEGKSLKGFSQFIKDARSSIEYLTSINKKNIIILGHSTGGFAVAALLENERDNIEKAIIISAFDSPGEYIRMYTYKYFNFASYLLKFWVKVFEFFQFGRCSFLKGFNSINNFQKPVLIIQGEYDLEVKFNMSLYALKDRYTNKNIKFELVEGTDHNPTIIKTERVVAINSKVFDFIDEFIGIKNIQNN
ncbi:MAG: alpha/beta fold hydrolase [Eubacteriales bacterium]